MLGFAVASAFLSRALKETVRLKSANFKIQQAFNFESLITPSSPDKGLKAKVPVYLYVLMQQIEFVLVMVIGTILMDRAIVTHLRDKVPLTGEA